MTHWPDPCGQGDARTLNASLLIPGDAKRVWVEQWVLDAKGLGCWLTHAQLGERLGLSARSVETYRLRLEAIECCVRLKEPGTRAHGWRSTLPAHCRMRSQRPAPADVLKYRDFLDVHIGDWLEPAHPVPKPRSQRAQNPQLASLNPAPVRVSAILSTAFDSQSVTTPSSALGVEGKRDRERTLETTPKADERPRAEVEAEGLARIRAAKSKSPRDPSLARAEGLALIKLERGETLTPAERALVDEWQRRHTGRKASSL